MGDAVLSQWCSSVRTIWTEVTFRSAMLGNWKTFHCLLAMPEMSSAAVIIHTVPHAWPLIALSKYYSGTLLTHHFCIAVSTSFISGKDPESINMYFSSSFWWACKNRCIANRNSWSIARSDKLLFNFQRLGKGFLLSGLPFRLDRHAL